MSDAPFFHIFPLPKCSYDVAEYLKPASKTRDLFAPPFYLCLPLTAANTLGWTLYNPHAFSVTWTGGSAREDVIVESDSPAVYSWLGYGTFTLNPQFLIHTSPGIDILVRPVPNHAKPAILTLEGIMENDWLRTSFTLNFMALMPLVKTTFAVGEPLVQLVPYPRHFIEPIQPAIIESGADYEARIADYQAWRERRKAQNDEGIKPDMQYMNGIDFNGEKVADHKKLFHLQKFTRVNESDE